MKLKRFALRGLIVLFVAVALCMFFARTVQNITTPKVQLVQSTSGRFEDKMTFRAQVYFAETEEFTVKEAKDMNITVDKLYVRAGNYVKKGDIIFTAKTPSYEEEIKKVREDYDAKNKELLELDVQNRKLSKESYQNTMYQQLLDAQDTLSEATYEARYAAAKESVVLTGDVSTWQSQLALSGEVSDDLKAAVNKARTAQAAYEEARAAYFAVLDNKKLKVSDDVFQYITKRNGLRTACRCCARRWTAIPRARLPTGHAPKSAATTMAASAPAWKRPPSLQMARSICKCRCRKRT